MTFLKTRHSFGPCVCVYVRVLVCVVDWGTGQAVLTLLDGSELGIGVVIGGAAAVVGMG